MNLVPTYCDIHPGAFECSVLASVSLVGCVVLVIWTLINWLGD